MQKSRKVLKETENYTYKKVEVIDGAFVKKKGIVDEIVRMTFHDETYERSLNNHYRKNKVQLNYMVFI